MNPFLQADNYHHYLVRAAALGQLVISTTCPHHRKGPAKYSRRKPSLPWKISTVCGQQIAVPLDRLFVYPKKSMPISCPTCGGVVYFATAKTIPGAWRKKNKAERRNGQLKKKFR